MVNLINRVLDEVTCPPALVCFIFHPELGLLTVKASVVVVVVVVVVAMTGPNNALFLLPPLPPSPGSSPLHRCTHLSQEAVRRLVGRLVG